MKELVLFPVFFLLSFYSDYVWELLSLLHINNLLIKEPIQPQKAIVEGIKKQKTSHHKPRGLSWSGVEWPKEVRKFSSKVIDVKNTTLNCMRTRITE